MRIDDAITNYPKATLKSLSKPVAMAFNRLKQTVKKGMKDDAFAAMIEEFRKNPIEEEEEVEEEESESEYSSESESNSESESESESDSSEESSNDYSEEGSSSDESSSNESSSDEASSSSSESSDEDDSDDNSSYYSYSSDSFASDSSSSDSEMEVNPKLTGRAKWVLQPKDIEKAKRKEEERLKKLEEKKKKQEEKEKEKKEKEDEVEVEDTYETPEKLVKALLQVLAARHRVPERRANVLQLQKLLPFARALGPKYELRVLSHLVCLQLAGVNSDAAMPAAQWAACLANVTRMVRVMISHQR